MRIENSKLVKNIGGKAANIIGQRFAGLPYLIDAALEVDGNMKKFRTYFRGQSIDGRLLIIGKISGVNKRFQINVFDLEKVNEAIETAQSVESEISFVCDFKMEVYNFLVKEFVLK